jgi:putative ATPase
MRALGYGKDYRYPHDAPGHFVAEEYLPDELRGRRWYEPGESGEERAIAERLARWREFTARRERKDRK